MPPDYLDVHKDEPIIGTCPYCHLPIYQSDPRNMVSGPHGGRPQAYHRGCNLIMKGHDLEAELTEILRHLRELGYTVEVKIRRPSGMS